MFLAAVRAAFMGLDQTTLAEAPFFWENCVFLIIRQPDLTISIVLSWEEPKSFLPVCLWLNSTTLTFSSLTFLLQLES